MIKITPIFREIREIQLYSDEDKGWERLIKDIEEFEEKDYLKRPKRFDDQERNYENGRR